MRKRDFIEITIVLFVILTGSLSKNEVLLFVKDYQSIVAAIIGSTIASTIAVIGWFRAYEFNNKVQNQRLKNEITNTARNEITKSIREYQIWLMDVRKFIESISNENSSEEAKNILKVKHFWNQYLEDYEILFPEIAKIRVQLMDRNTEIMGLISELDVSVYSFFELMKEKNMGREFPAGYVLDQVCLMEDLRIYLQNRCLGEITGNRVPDRDPRDKSVPKIVTNKDGLLEIENNTVGITKLSLIIQNYKKGNKFPY